MLSIYTNNADWLLSKRIVRVTPVGNSLRIKTSANPGHPRIAGPASELGLHDGGSGEKVK